MAPTHDILPALLNQKSKLVDTALSEALRHAEPDEAGGLALAVLGRDRPDRSVGLILRFHELPEEVRYQVVERAEQLSTAIRKAGTRHSVQGARNALTLIEQSASTRMAYLITALIRHAEPTVRECAADCLRGLASRCAAVGPDQPPHLDALSIRYLTEAVEQAVVLYANHDHPAVLEALAQLAAHPMPEAWAALSNNEHAAISPLGAMAKSPANAEVGGAMFALLAVAPLRVEVVEGLGRLCRQEQLEAPLCQGHLLALPAVRKGLRRAHDSHKLWPNLKQRGRLSPDAQRHLPAYACALPMDGQDRVLRLAELVRAKHSATRLATLRRLLAIATDPALPDPRAADNANDAIAAFTTDPDVPLARTALWHLIRVQYGGLPRILANLVNSRHPEIRAVAARRFAPMGFERFWVSWPKFDPARRLAAGRALIKIDPDFHRHLGAKLGSRDPAVRLRALGIIATLAQGPFFEPALIELVGSEDPRVVASAVRALGGCTSDASREVLALAMDHDDARIRANAVEALAKADAARHLDKLIAIAQEDAQRPRANAIRALMELRTRDALPALTQMLHDTRAEHRVSALWLIDELGLLQLARQVAEMSISDGDDRVKQRAGHVVQHLIEDLDRQVAEQDQATEAA